MRPTLPPHLSPFPVSLAHPPQGLSSSGVYKPAANAPQGARVTLPKPQPVGSTSAPAKEATEKDVSAALKVANKPAGSNPGLEMFQKYQAKNAVKPMVDITK